ncbi:MAG: hypothetical protein ACOX6Q_00635 [Candidatus Dojkabacteria bacterium]|jgi:hypothetical protein
MIERKIGCNSQEVDSYIGVEEVIAIASEKTDEELLADKELFAKVAMSYLRNLKEGSNVLGGLGVVQFGFLSSEDKDYENWYVYEEGDESWDVYINHASDIINSVTETTEDDEEKSYKVQYRDYVLDILAANFFSEELWRLDKNDEKNDEEQFEKQKSQIERCRGLALQRISRNRFNRQFFREEDLIGLGSRYRHSYFLEKGLIGTPDEFRADIQVRLSYNAREYSDKSIVMEYIIDLKNYQKRQEKEEDIYEYLKECWRNYKDDQETRGNTWIVEGGLLKIKSEMLESNKAEIRRLKENLYLTLENKFENLNTILQRFSDYGIPLSGELRKILLSEVKKGFNMYGRPFNFKKAHDYYSQENEKREKEIEELRNRN